MKKLLLPILFLLHLSALAQKKPLDHNVFDGWQNIAGQQISDNGKWVGFVIKPQEGDASLNIVNASGKNRATFQRADTVRFTADSKYAIFLIRPFYKDIRQAKIKKKKPAEFPKDTLGVIALGNSQLTKVPAIS
ncbi:MAG: S9 family peptidase, partial [Mucilaginibacter sp.]|nr:S9 family peptidase [Mucilaginibacter sp.]